MSTETAVPVYIDELLCYIASKLLVMTGDDLVNICINAFTDSNITASKLLLFDTCQRGPTHDAPTSGIKYRACKGEHKSKNNVKDVIALFQELGSTAPKFAAADLNVLPVPSIDSVDINALLKGMELLRGEVSALTRVVTSQQGTISDLVKTITEKSTVPLAVSYAQIAAANTSSGPPEQPAGPNGRSTGGRPPQGGSAYNRNDDKKKRTVHLGKKSYNDATPNSHPKVVGMKRIKRAELFVTRFSPDCEADDIKSYIYANLNLDATVEKMKNTRNSECSSFHISCVCDDPKLFYNAELWPEHVLYRRWYPARRPRVTNSDNGGH